MIPGGPRSVDAQSKSRIIDAISPDPARKSGAPCWSTVGCRVPSIQNGGYKFQKTKFLGSNHEFPNPASVVSFPLP